MIHKSVLVTGGAGFIGSHLCSFLLKKNNEVFAVDNLATGNKENIEPFLRNARFHFIQDDCQSALFIKRISKIHFDEIYDLASPASVTYITEHPVEAAIVNSIGLKNLLDLTKAQKARILFASSSEVYGDPIKHPQKESDWGNVNCVGVRSGYDEGKRFGEALTIAYHRQFGIDVKIVRIFNTYGPNSNVTDSRVIPRFITQALKGESLTVHGNGMQTRSLCYVTDLVRGIMSMMQSDKTGPINIGNPHEQSILRIAKNIINKTQSSSKIVFVKRPEDDPGKRKPDVTLAEQMLHWKAQISFDVGLVKTIAYFKKKLYG